MNPNEYEALLDVLPTSIALHHAGVVVWANASFCRHVGKDLGSLTGRSLSSLELEFEAGPDLDWKGARVSTVFAPGAAPSRELQEKAMLSARMASLGTVAASVAHEINNPLAFVLAQVELAQRARLAGGVVGYEALETIRDGLERLRGVVVDLRAFSKGDTDSVRNVDVRAVLGRVLRMADKSLLSRAHVIEDLAPVPPVLGNEGRLSQVFLNLLVNAAEALPETPRESNRIRIRTRACADGRVEIAIGDTGAGIDLALKDRIFDSFFTTKGSRSGTGLGLAICRRIISEHGGEVFARTVDSDEIEPPFRTEFVTLLPVALLPPAPPIESAPPPKSGPSRRVLLVDDEPRLLRTLGGLLSSNHEVTTADSGEKALQLLANAKEPFEVIVCDMMMHGLDGVGFHELVQSRYPGLERRVIFMTGGAFTKRARSFLLSVPNKRLDKPFELHALNVAIEEVSNLAD